MGLRRYVKKGEREYFLVVFVVLAGLAAYLAMVRSERADAPRLPAAAGVSEGMDKLWLEAALAKPDMRPLPDEGMFEELVPQAPEPAPEPTPAAAPEPAPEPAPAFPTPLATAEPEPAPRPRISPMRESMLGSGSSGNTSAAFLAFPAKAVQGAVSPPSAPPARPSALPAKKRTMRPLSGK